VAHDVDFPPCQLSRLLIEHLLGVGHKAVGALLRDPHDKIPRLPPPESPGAIHHAGDETAQADLCARITADVVRCVAWDHVASPAVDASRHTAGREYEDLLEGISLFLFPYGQID
jgi:hypothetical protein